MSKHKSVKQGLALATLLALVSLDIFVVRFLCTHDGFMTPREFSIGAIIAVSFNLLIAFFLRSVLPLRACLVPLWTVFGMWLAWYNPAPERLHYWMTMEQLHIGMTIRKMQEAVKPYPLQKDIGCQRKLSNSTANPTVWCVPGYTGTSPYRMYDATYITTKNGTVTEIRYGFDD